MSYSFSVTAKDKEAAAAAVRAKLQEVVASQEVHKADAEQACIAAGAFLGALPDDADQDVSASVSGWIETRNGEFVRANVSVTVCHSVRKAEGNAAEQAQA